MSDYKSLYSPGKNIAAAQYITELVCRNKANYQKITLPSQFWKLPEWRQFYGAQITKCNQLLETYHEVIIIKIVQERNIFSLYAKWIIKEFDKETEKTLLLAQSIKEVKYDRVENSKGKDKKDLDLSYLDE